MSEKTPQEQSPEELQQSVAKLAKALDAEREAHKATKSQLTAASAGEIDKILAERLAPVENERDAAREEAKANRSRWADDRRDRAITEALSASGCLADFIPEALAYARQHFVVSDTGEVRTIEADGVCPGLDANQYVLGQLRSMKPGLWPRTIGGGASGSGRATPLSLDLGCFRDGNMTGIARFASIYGNELAARECRRHGINADFLMRAAKR
ncbi:MAG: hypothetical protein AB7Q00_13910 [Phycisphaerales bacterium]